MSTGKDSIEAALSPAPVVLVADDNADARDIVSEFLAYLGCCVLVAGDGEEAVRTATLVRPDVIVMDMSMPRMDGVEACSRLRAEPSTARTPIVAVTGFGRPWEERARRAGCDAFFEKPLDLSAFKERLRSLLPALGRALAR